MTRHAIRCGRGRQRQAGIAALELALILPVIVVLFLSLVDLARAIQANMILINLGREAANLSARSKVVLSDNAQTIIGQVAASAPPLDMNKQGMLYITQLMGQATGSTATPTRTIVQGQYRLDDSVNNRGYRVSGYAPASKIWTCSNWAGAVAGSCVVPTGNATPVSSMLSNELADGQVVYVVEVFYKFNMVFAPVTLGSTGTSTIGPDLYSMSVY